MLQVHRVFMGLVIFVGLIWSVSSVGFSPASVRSTLAPHSYLGATLRGSDGSTLLAARYHHRQRTNRFFGRSRGHC